MADDKENLFGLENRVQRLEKVQVDLKVVTAEHQQQLAFLSQKLDDGFQSVLDKIESSTTPLQKQTDETSQHLDAISERVGEQGRALENAKARAQADAAKVERWKTWIAAIVTGAVAILVEKIFEHYSPTFRF